MARVKRDGGIVKDWFFAQNNPSAAFGVSSLYTREPLVCASRLFANRRKLGLRSLIKAYEEEANRKIDDLFDITVGRDAGKLAIIGYNHYSVRISMRFIKFGRTKIDPPWEE